MIGLVALMAASLVGVSFASWVAGYNARAREERPRTIEHLDRARWYAARPTSGRHVRVID